MTWNDPISGVVVFVLLFLFTNSIIFFIFYIICYCCDNVPLALHYDFTELFYFLLGLQNGKR